ncbi:hypothetical protein XENOCAPTIV_011109 [Xenoophorus captivus]|uniref:Uncharacterized protein n=1 Tax=Xenoophorus captivus TaxID=1517983 RepID=A0ABV0SFQ1_9TELE
MMTDPSETEPELYPSRTVPVSCWPRPLPLYLMPPIGAGEGGGRCSVSRLTAQDQHGSVQGNRTPMDPHGPLQDCHVQTEPGPDPTVPVCVLLFPSWLLELTPVPTAPSGPVPALSQGRGPVLGLRSQRQAQMDRTVPACPGLRSEPRPDPLVPGREAERVRMGPIWPIPSKDAPLFPLFYSYFNYRKLKTETSGIARGPWMETLGCLRGTDDTQTLFL